MPKCDDGEAGQLRAERDVIEIKYRWQESNEETYFYALDQGRDLKSFNISGWNIDIKNTPCHFLLGLILPFQIVVTPVRPQYMNKFVDDPILIHQALCVVNL